MKQLRATLGDPDGVPPPRGHYSHVGRLDLPGGALVFVSGQLALGDDGELVGEGSMSRQTERVFDLLARILASQGASFADVVNIRSYLTDLGAIEDYARVRRRHLTARPPTSTTVEVSRLLVPGALVEVELTAFARSSPGVPEAQVTPSR